MGRLLSLFKLQVPFLENGHSGIHFIKLLGNTQCLPVKKISDVAWLLGKDLAENTVTAYSKCSVTFSGIIVLCKNNSIAGVILTTTRGENVNKYK